jgi:protein-tyrosine-phosphatase
MAEAFLSNICGENFEAHSAGLEPGKLNPIVVDAMREVGIDISRNETKAIFEIYKSGKSFAYVVTVCDEASAERCPIFPGVTTRLHWSFPDPSALQARTMINSLASATSATRSGLELKPGAQRFAHRLLHNSTARNF